MPNDRVPMPNRVDDDANDLASMRHLDEGAMTNSRHAMYKYFRKAPIRRQPKHGVVMAWLALLRLHGRESVRR
jgi:hypothetical protein